MSAKDDAIATGNTALNNLYALMNAALAAHDATTQARVQSSIDDLTDKLDQLNKAAIAADDARLGPLNTQLNQVTTSATAAMADLSTTITVLNDVAAAAKLIDGILGIVAGL